MLLRLSFKQKYFNLKISYIILQMFIVIKININKIYKKISFLYLQTFEVKIYNFFENYYNKK